MTKNVTFGWAVPSFGGSEDAHIDVPMYEEPNFQITKDTALLCESLGFESLWIADHLILGKEYKIFECWTLLSALASVTKKIRLGTLVLCYAFRYPSLLAKMAATLDVISGGRLILGLGAGWNIHEAESYGINLPDKASVRINQLIETIKIIKSLWTDKKATLKGKYYSINEAICEPKPLQKPHPPIWIGSLVGGKVMPKVTALYADGWNTIARPPEVMVEKIEALKEACREVKRDFNTLTLSIDNHILIAKNEREVDELKKRIRKKSPNYPSYAHFDSKSQKAHGVKEKFTWEEFSTQNFIGTPDQIVEQMKAYVKLGISHFVLWFLDFPSHDGLKLFGEEVISQFK
ncbi:MAG: LLM class flavin-dependent oxidoreductase [Nitrososphaerales archaeon]